MRSGAAESANPVAHGLAWWARHDPERLAIANRDRSMTFEEVDALAATLAARLLELPPGWLPILVDRTPASMVAIHAAVRAGRPFAAVDHDTPRARLEHLLGRLGSPAVALVDRPELGSVLPDAVTALTVPDEAGDGAGPVDLDPLAEACVIFTSGSTGMPKGVVHSWGAFATSRQNASRRSVPGLVEGAPAHVALFSPLSFIAGLFRVTDMSAGKSYSLADPSSMSLEQLAAWLEQGRFDALALTPSTAASLLSLWQGHRRLDTVRVLRTYGEPLLWEHVPAMRALIRPDASVVSGYGASEAISAGVRYEITPDMELGQGRVPLGFARDERRVGVEPLDDPAAAPSDVAAGHTIGELALGGWLATRYLGDPELTARRFVTRADGTRVWRSGDLVTLAPDGCFTLVGRLDDMVKIRGKLVEPAEAERALRAIEGIEQVAVLPHRTATGGHRLVGHVVVRDGAALSPGAVRRRLVEALPPHLVPSVLTRHDDLPVTSRGKLDRVRLQSAPLAPWRDRAPRPPRDELERLVVHVASELLEVSDLDAGDDLWDVGLDSLAAVELCAALADAGHGELDPTDLLRHRTPVDLARHLARSERTAGSEIVRLNAGGAGRPFVFIPGAGMTALSARGLAAAVGADHPVAVVEASGLHRQGRMDRTVEAAARSALRAVREAGLDADHERPLVIGGFSAGGPVAYELARLLHVDGHAVHVVLFDAGLPSANRAGRRRRPAARRLRRAARSPRSLAGWVVREARIVRYTVWPGSRPARAERYTAFKRVARRAVARHVAPSMPFPVTVFQVEGSRAGESARAVVPHAEVITVGGRHRTHLDPPHVSEVGLRLRQLLGDRGA